MLAGAFVVIFKCEFFVSKETKNQRSGCRYEITSNDW